jgi:hypothetical protein
VTNETKEQFMAERVRALATVILTRRDDLTITETKQGRVRPWGSSWE